MRDRPNASYDDMLKTIAIARLIFGGDMNIQAPPNLTPEKYELYLDAGINDWGGVSPLTPDFINPEAPWPALQTLKQKSAEAGFDLRARLPIYPEFIAQAEKFLPASLVSYVERLAGIDGLVKDGGPLRSLPSTYYADPSVS
jgi:FO synthase